MLSKRCYEIISIVLLLKNIVKFEMGNTQTLGNEFL